MEKFWAFAVDEPCQTGYSVAAKWRRGVVIAVFQKGLARGLGWDMGAFFGLFSSEDKFAGLLVGWIRDLVVVVGRNFCGVSLAMIAIGKRCGFQNMRSLLRQSLVGKPRGLAAYAMIQMVN